MITHLNFRKDVPIVNLQEVVIFLDNLRKPITEKDRVEGPYPYYGANGIQGYINEYIFDEELVLLAEDGGHFGDPDRGIAYKVSGKCWVNNHAHVLKTKPNIDINYLTRVLENLDLSTYINGTTRAKLTKGNAEKIKIPLPPLEEQQRIAAILDKAELLKRKRELAIEKLDSLSESIFEKIENSKEFLDFPVVKLGDIMELQRGGSPRPIADWITEEEDGINWIKISDATASDKYIYKCKQKIKKGGDRHSRMVYEGDFLLSNSMSFGRPYILKTSGCIHDGWLVLRDAKNLFEQDYLYSVLSSPSVKRQFIKFASGAVVKNLNIDAVSKVEIRLLDKQSQLMFSRKVSVIELYKKQLKDADSLFNKLTSSLQQLAFSSQL